MDLGRGNISLLQTSMIILLCVGLMNHVLVIPVLLDKGGRDAWISTLFTIVPLFLWIPLIHYILKKIKNAHLFEWLKEKYSSWVAWLLVIPFLIYLYLIGFITVHETTTWLVTSNLPQTPIIVTGTVFMILCFFAARSGINSIAILSGILLPLVVILGYFASFTNAKFKDYGLLLPMLEHGIRPAFDGMIIAGAGAIELVIVLLFRRHIVADFKLWHLWLLGFFFIYLVVEPVIGAISEFGPFSAALQRYPAFEEWRLVKIGKHLEHVDFLVVYQWTAGAFIRIATALFLIIDLLHLKSKRSKTIGLLFITLSIIAANQLPISDQTFLYLLTEYYFPLSLIVMVLCSFVLFVLAVFAKENKEVTK